MERLSVRQLEYIAAVAEAQSFGEAARRCHVTQPALSIQVAQAEAQLGVQLFERDRRRFLVTEAGVEVVHRAQRLLAGLDDLTRAAQAYGDLLQGRVRLGVIPTIAPFVLPRSLATVRRKFPGLRMMLREDETSVLVREVSAGNLDLILVALEADLGGLEVLELFRDPFVAVLPRNHRMTRRKRFSEADLAGESVLLLEDGH